MLRPFVAVAIALLAGCTREIPDREIVGFLASPFAMTTRVEWTLYQVEDRTATPLIATDVARSIGGRDDVDQQRIVCLLHTRPQAGKITYRLEPVGARRFTESGWSTPHWPSGGTRTMIPFCDPVADLPPQAETIVFVEGAPAPPNTREMTVERFAAQAPTRCVVVTVRWWDDLAHAAGRPIPPLEQAITAPAAR